MTTRTTFGDLASDAASHLQRPIPPGDAASSLRSVIVAMRRHCAAVCTTLAGPDAAEAHHGPWASAAAQVQEALTSALELLPPGPGHATGLLPGPGQPGLAPGDLRAAAMSIVLAGDLLATHLTSLPDGTRAGRSDWALSVASPALARALLYELGGWSRHAASAASQAAVSGVAATPAARRDLTAACQWLWQASQVIANAQLGQPVTEAEQMLLRSIPVNHIPARLLPVGGEPVAQLCDAITGTAERAREAARADVPHAAWSPALTRESLRETAAHCVVTAWNCRNIIDTLYATAAQATRLPAPVRAQLARAARAVNNAGAAWLEAAGQWDTITTDTRPRSPHALSHAAVATMDLALWTGRLAYADPAWTPQQGPSSAVRQPASLVRRSGDLRRVITAVHHACHAMTQLARADQAQLRTAARTGRLIVPVRSLPDRYDIPRIYAHAPPDRVTPVLAAYHHAHATSERATAALDTIATTIRAPSQALTAARAITRAAASQQHASHDTGPAAPPHPAQRQPGPVERILRDLDVTSPADLQRAAAIDTEADQLILRAAHHSPYPRPGWDLATSVGTAELIHHALATGDPAAALIHPPDPAHQLQAEIEP